MEDNLKALRQNIIQRTLREIADADPALYYQSTSRIARLIYSRLQDASNLTAEELKAVAELTYRDIEALLSFHQKTP